MHSIVPVQPVDYLVAGHISCDITPKGLRLGGTATYAALTARALGLRVGVVTTWGEEVPQDALVGIQIHNVAVKQSTTFENVTDANGRKQIVHHVAPDIKYENIPVNWRKASIIHVGPIVGEGKGLLDGNFHGSMLGVTPQGWLRAWDKDGLVHAAGWDGMLKALPKANAVVISVEDLEGDEDRIEVMANCCRVLAVTEAASGARLYWNGDLRSFHALHLKEVDATGAGDIFAAAFFWRYMTTGDPWTAAKFATHLASFSITRTGLEGIPMRDEIQKCLVEVL
jgi:sugar/nucleoside kinase (ribokinase family)